MKVQLDGVSDKVLRMMLPRFKELVKPEMPTKVTKTAGQDELTQVELFIRVSEHKVLASINGTLRMEMELKLVMKII